MCKLQCKTQFFSYASMRYLFSNHHRFPFSILWQQPWMYILSQHLVDTLMWHWHIDPNGLYLTFATFGIVSGMYNPPSGKYPGENKACSKLSHLSLFCVLVYFMTDCMHGTTNKLKREKKKETKYMCFGVLSSMQRDHLHIRVFFPGGLGVPPSGENFVNPPHPTLVPVFAPWLVPLQSRFVPENLKI